MTDEQESPDINSEYFSSASSRDLLLSEFQIDYCDGTESTFEVREWRISEDTMLDLIQKKLFNADTVAANHLIDFCETALKKLQAMFRWVSNQGIPTGDLDRYQPVFIMLVDYIIRHLPCQDTGNSTADENLQVHPVNRVALRGRVQCLNSEEAVCERNLSGYADISVMRGPDIHSIGSWLFHVGITAPLKQIPLNVKHQLVGQSEVIAQMKNDWKPVLGCLTNMADIMLSLRLPCSRENTYDRLFFNTTSTTVHRAYIIRLLFLFCDLTLEELTELTQGSTTADVELMANARNRSFEDSDAPPLDGNEAHESQSTIARKRAKIDRSLKEVEVMYLNYDSEEENYINEERLRSVNEWDARRNGFTYLSKKNLDALQNELR